MIVRSGTSGGNKRRLYKPSVEALDALRLLSTAVQGLPDLAIELNLPSDAGSIGEAAPGSLDATWDVALLADLRKPAGTVADPEAIASGLSQLNRYLSRAWYRAGIPEGRHEDCSQAVYLALLENLERDHFDALVGDIGNLGIRDVVNRETEQGPGFFRAVDTIKKRAQRERGFQPLDLYEGIATPGEDEAQSRRREALREVIDESLTPREADLICATLDGKTPAEIAIQCGLTPKTISNEKSRVIQKLRELLADDLDGIE
ncbi:MAG: sigma-70 family RNA polymerase sigma factor [Singulisphaera sp.]